MEPSRQPDPDTIVAVATAPGRGGIGVVRLSGPAAQTIAALLVTLVTPLKPGHARFTHVLDPADATAPPVDQAVITFFRAPHSYTGDDVVEISTHGSPVILSALVHSAIRAGARLAQPGEFTQRAFLNRRIDLTQAEAVHDLIAAQTLEQARMAARQLNGGLSRRVAPAKEQLLHLIALLEAGMDFAAGELDDVDVVPPAQIEAFLQAITHPLEALASSYAAGSRLREGASLALVGRPNVGKSSLFNRLVERDRAIVTPLPGTTRDTVEESISLGGIPLRLIDTAGLRLTGDAPSDHAETLGIARSREAMADADLVLLVLDVTAPVSPEESAMIDDLAPRPHLIVRNKADLAHTPASIGPDAALETSAVTGTGIDRLKAALLRLLNAGGSPVADAALNSLRQHQAVENALAAIRQARSANHDRVPHEFLLADLHRALDSLDSLTGATTPDDILQRIFSTFCIGK